MKNNYNILKWEEEKLNQKCNQKDQLIILDNYLKMKVNKVYINNNKECKV